MVLRHFDWRLQTPHLQDYYPRYTDHCSLIAQRVSIRNLLSVLYSTIYSHYCCYILIHCAACTQVDHPSILYPCTNYTIFIYFFQTTYVSKVFIDQFLLKVSLLSLATTNYLPREKANQKKVVCLMFSWRVTLKLKAAIVRHSQSKNSNKIGSATETLITLSSDSSDPITWCQVYILIGQPLGRIS